MLDAGGGRRGLCAVKQEHVYQWASFNDLNRSEDVSGHVCPTHSDCPKVGCVIQPVDGGRVQAQVVVFAEVPVQLQFLCCTQTT